MVAPVRSSPRSSGPTAAGAAGTMLSFTALLWVLEFYDQFTGGQLDHDGIVPRTAGRARGHPLGAPAARRLGAPHREHAPVPDLRVPRAGERARAVRAGHRHGLGARRAGGVAHRPRQQRDDRHVRGDLRLADLPAGPRASSRAAARQIVLAVVLFLLWGGILLGVLPGQADVSWQGHLFGALAGVLAAWLVAPRRRLGRRRTARSSERFRRAARSTAAPGPRRAPI